MMVRDSLFALFAVFAVAIFLAGCAAPQYFSCCQYGPATENDTCILANGTEYDTLSCNEELLTCNVSIDEDEVALPVCPQIEQIKCNSSCMGMFCGKFDYDPRPPPDPTAFLDTESSAEDLGGMGDVERFGLYGAECRFLNMSPAVIRASANTRGGFALNVFRFGIGNSFEEFEQAALYYPLTDLGCQLNPMGEVERYTNYAIPNQKMGGGQLCEGFLPAGSLNVHFRCTGDSSISSPNYYDCAVRCIMDGAGYPASIDASNPYTTYKDGVLLGNPFSYGLSGSYSTRDSPSIIPDSRYRDRAMAPLSSVSSFDDNYYSGFVYYGADFASDVLTKDGGWEVWMADMGAPEGETNTLYDYYYGESSKVPMLSWRDHAIEMITVARDPHTTYATLLSYHSVYGNQMTVGHYTKDGTWKPGAEFECLEGRDCISSMCNKDIYSRGVCTSTINPLQDALCDCMELGDEIVCEGKQTYYATPWDYPGGSVRGTYTLSAVVVEPETLGGYTSFTQIDVPSKGKMVTKDLDGDGVDEKYIVIYLGGPDQYPDYDALFYMSGSDEGEYLNSTLTLDMVLSRDKWRFCDPAKGCGRFFTTFVDECFADVDGTGRSDYGLNFVGVCYSSPAYGITNSWGDVDTHGERSRLCEKIRGREEFFCYQEDGYEHCELLASAALVVEAKEVDYTMVSPDGTETTVQRLAFGKCIMDEDGEKLETRTYGMCEPCSYLTIAKDTVVKLPENPGDPGYENELGGYPNNYCPLLVINTPYYYDPGHFSGAVDLIGDSAGKGFSIWESGGREYLTDSVCTMPDGSGAGKFEAWPDYLPNAYYLKEKIGEYEKRNILPVIFATDSALYKRMSDPGDWDMDIHVDVRTSDDSIYYASHPLIAEIAEERLPLIEKFAMESPYVRSDLKGYMVEGSKYLANSLYNQGAAVVVVDMDEEGAVLGPYISDMRGSRSNFVKALCPNCMIAIGSGYSRYGDPKSNEQKMAELMFTFEVQNATTSNWISGTEDHIYGLNFSCEDEAFSCQNLGGVDIIVEKWVLDAQNSHCELDRGERFQRILDDKMEFGSKVLKRFGKPIIVTDFTIERGGAGNCWDDEDAAAFMIFLGQHTEDLVRSGHVGLIYSNWTTEKSESVKTGLRYDTPGGVLGERGEVYAGSLYASRYFSGFNKKSMITEVDISDSCPCTPCLPYEPDETCNGKFMGIGEECTGYEGGREKWQDFCISSDVCIMGSAVGGYEIHCNIYYANGTEESKTYDGADVAANPQLYKDVISAIKNSDKVPCFTSATRNLSYTRLESHGFSSYPVVFRKDGNFSYSCSPGVETTICGYTPPFTDTQMDCLIGEKGSMVRLPPLGERIEERSWPLGGEVTAGVPLEGMPLGGLPGG